MLAFIPDHVEENHQLKDLFDDDVDVIASVKDAVAVPKGETLIWDHIYTRGGPGYQVRSGDRGDIELLRIYGVGRGARVRAALTLYFSDGRFDEHEWDCYWTEPDLTVVSSKNVLGVLQGKTLCWFRVALTLLDGVDAVSVERCDFFWEARDIEKGDYALNNIIDIEGIGRVYAEKLRGLGIHTVEQLLFLGRRPSEREALAERSGISEKRILRWVNMADLFRINGVGEEYSDLLEVSGVESIDQLACREHAELHRQLQQTNEERNLVRVMPSINHVKQWIIQARNMNQLVIH